MAYIFVSYFVVFENLYSVFSQEPANQKRSHCDSPEETDLEAARGIKSRGVHPSEAMMHSPLFQIVPPIF